MRRASLLLVVLAAAPAAHAAKGTAVGVSQEEFRIAVHRDRVPAGVVRFNVTNLGEDAHDLVVRRKGRVLARLEEVGAGGQATLRTRLRTPGRYRLVCTVADHEARGMRSVLRVVSR
jgi:plastocyanin